MPAGYGYLPDSLLLVPFFYSLFSKPSPLMVSKLDTIIQAASEAELDRSVKGTIIKRTEVDRELEELLSKQKATIKVVGTGGGGNNTINRITEVGVAGAETIALNTDAQDLLYTTADKKILLGKEMTHGLGAGSNQKVGEEAARESEQVIKQALTGSDMVFITCGLGGGTGTGSAPVVAEIAKKMGALTVAVVTMPFAMEGLRRYENAAVGLEKLEQIVDTEEATNDH